MPYYKDLQNKLHFIEREFAHLLPAGCVEITDEEAAILSAPTPEQIAAKRRSEILSALDNIDRKSIRSIRENDTVRIQVWENQAAALRAELAGL